MGWLSDAWDSTKDAVSDAWSGTKDAIRDVTGVDSINNLLMTGGLSMVPAQLSGQGIFGEALATALSPLTQPYGQGQAPTMMSGSLSQPAPASLTMGTGGGGSAVTRGSPQDLASYFGGSGYGAGPSQTSAALLQANPEAFKFAPLTSSLV